MRSKDKETRKTRMSNSEDVTMLKKERKTRMKEEGERYLASCSDMSTSHLHA
jgi:hypothetical protein